MRKSLGEFSLSVIILIEIPSYFSYAILARQTKLYLLARAISKICWAISSAIGITDKRFPFLTTKS